jgi:aldehyde dehydrogenase (NAD+)
MEERLKFYIDGQWVDPIEGRVISVINPATEEPIARVALGGPKDVDRAVAAARKAFESFSRTSKQERIDLLKSVVGAYQKRYADLVQTVSKEMGAPVWLAQAAQAATGLGHLNSAIQVLTNYEFEEKRGTTLIVREPVGVCGFITPWNWPLNQMVCKVAPALAAGCTMVLKPSEYTPLDALIFAEILHDAGVPAGVFNLVNGDGAGVGNAIASHPGIDMVSFTGSTRAGILVAKAAADTVKRVTQELGGKSANVILDDTADFDKMVAAGVQGCFLNSGQSCNAPTRMLVPESMHARAVEVAKQAAQGFTVGDPQQQTSKLGPVVNETQWKKIQGLIQKGIDEGAQLVAGGTGRPDGLSKGYYVKPTIFAGVHNEMTVAREEIFGPVLAILPYKTEEEAIQIANDTPYGLSGYVSGSPERARNVAARLRTGNVHINGAGPDFAAPFGGYKQSGNGREWGEFGFEEFLEVKAMLGAAK